ncbi:unnamed protein product [Prorocentrum cordatum]|uniref:H(+)-exporting diphosphatase n=1 Tax=Prorocentrum cordatum TaxID=2364126 RepID=A0ABN9WLD9_9DINO|nr:unnamed protein product [Polarella glacialis]|mmetsp:Transcript_42573/g.110899  ORF Transcript_42573/g.110899 Transcript_42573/m.110899 type:complete len:220 (-) Transcript_42573:239-898(-)
MARDSGKTPLGESDYKKMGMGDANLFIVYPAFQTVFALPGIIGAYYSLFVAKSDAPVAKVSNIAAANAGPMYLAWVFLKYATTSIGANLGTARRATGVNVPDQHVYKVVGGVADGAPVLMDDSHELYGQFNRAQRALQNFNETLPFFVGEFFLAGYVFPLATSICTAFAATFKLKGALDYTEERNKRMSGNMTANLFGGGLAGIIMVVGVRSTYLQFKR